MPRIERGDIYTIDVLDGEIEGRELCGPHVWLILSIGQINERLHLFTAVPLTSVINRQTEKPKDEGAFRYFRPRILNEWKTADPGVSSSVFQDQSIALPEQIRVFSERRITSSRLGTFSKEALAAVEVGLAFIQGKGIIREVLAPASAADHKASALAVFEEPARPLPGRPKPN